MSKGKRRICIPKYAAPVARSIALKVAAIRAKRGETIEESAARLGIPEGAFFYLESGRKIPGPQLAARLLEWAHNPGYQAPGPLTERNYGLEKKGEWKKVKCAMPAQEYQRIRKVAYMAGMSMSQFFYFAARMLVSNKQAFATVADAAQELAWTRSLQALQEAPELRELLKIDVDMLAEKGLVQDTQQIEKPSIIRFLDVQTDKLQSNNLEEEIDNGEE